MFWLMATVFRIPNRPFYLMQIRLQDGSRPPYKSTKTTKKSEALEMANDWETRARREHSLENEMSGRGFLSIVMEAERLANEGGLSATRAEELVRKLHALANPEASRVTLRSHWDAVIARETGSIGDSAMANLTFARKRWSAAMGAKMDAPLAKLVLEDFEKAFPKMAVGLAAGTVSLYRTMLQKVMNDAVGRKLIDSNPAATLQSVSRLKGLKETTRRGVFTPKEIRMLLDAAGDEWRGMILAGFYSSLRLMDVAKLSSDDIENGFIYKTSSKSITDTDTPIHPRLMEWIDGRKGPFFPNQCDATKATVSSRFSALMKKAGVGKLRTVRKRTVTRSYHSLRHSFASIVANADVPQDVRMALTGSSDAKIASRYVHVSDEKLMEAIAALPNIELEEGAA